MMKERIRQHFNECSQGFAKIQDPKTYIGQYVMQCIKAEKSTMI